MKSHMDKKNNSSSGKILHHCEFNVGQKFHCDFILGSCLQASAQKWTVHKKTSEKRFKIDGIWYESYEKVSHDLFQSFLL